MGKVEKKLDRYQAVLSLLEMSDTDGTECILEENRRIILKKCRATRWPITDHAHKMETALVSNVKFATTPRLQPEYFDLMPYEMDK